MILEPLAKTAKSIAEKRFTLEFPEERDSMSDREKYMFRLDMPTCINCAACERICPNKTIDMVDALTDKGEKKFPQIGIERCLFCGLCEEVCPTKCLTLTKGYELEAYDKRDYVKRPEELQG
jgi:formate hydrogenlyase subunit 6/NADH:ubiquinone oxidoreductase subunit I